MAYNHKKELSKPERFAPGHRLCSGCGAGILCRAVTRALDEDDKAVICNATGCLEVSSFLYPYTAWQDSYIHSAFENASAVASGVAAAYKRKREKGELDATYKIIAIGGDGGTYDIGFQSLSGAMERGTDMAYFCYDNEAYMNTGIQRSSSTPRFANATTTPAGIASAGKEQNKKDLTELMAAHNIPYVAQTTFIGNMKDMHEKAHRAIYTPGAAFVNVMAPCPRGWQYKTEDLALVCKMAVETCVWPLYEVIDGEWFLSYEPRKKLPVEEFMKLQGRFRHCFRAGNEWTIAEAQRFVDEKWQRLLDKCSR